VKKNIEELYLRITFVMMLGLARKIVRVDVGNDFPFGGDFLVDKYNTADDDDTHPACQ